MSSAPRRRYRLVDEEPGPGPAVVVRCWDVAEGWALARAYFVAAFPDRTRYRRNWEVRHEGRVTTAPSDYAKGSA